MGENELARVKARVRAKRGGEHRAMAKRAQSGEETGETESVTVRRAKGKERKRRGRR